MKKHLRENLRKPNRRAWRNLRRRKQSLRKRPIIRFRSKKTRLRTGFKKRRVSSRSKPIRRLRRGWTALRRKRIR